MPGKKKGKRSGGRQKKTSEGKKQTEKKEESTEIDNAQSSLPPSTEETQTPASFQSPFLQIPNAMDFPVNDSPAIRIVEGLMGKAALVVVSDGRLFEGIIACTDRNTNLILRNAEEQRTFQLSADNDSSTTVKESNYVGLIIIPGNSIVTIRVPSNDLFHAKSPKDNEEHHDNKEQHNNKHDNESEQ